MSRVQAKPYEDLPSKQQAFIDRYLVHGDRDRAYVEAGYKPGRRSLKPAAYALYRKLQDTIQVEIDKRIGRHAVLALAIVKQLMEDEKQPGSVRLNAAKDYLNRAGYDKPVESRVTIDDLRDVDNDEVNDEIQALLKKALGEQPTQH